MKTASIYLANKGLSDAQWAYDLEDDDGESVADYGMLCSLEDLLEVLLRVDCIDAEDLPTFGGEIPDGLRGVISCDATRFLIDTHSPRIILRYEPCDACMLSLPADECGTATVTARWVSEEGSTADRDERICSECLAAGDPLGPGYCEVVAGWADEFDAEVAVSFISSSARTQILADGTWVALGDCITPGTLIITPGGARFSRQIPDGYLREIGIIR